VEISDSTLLNGKTAVTISMWINPSLQGIYDAPLNYYSFANGGNNKIGFAYPASTGNYLRFTLQTSSALAYVDSSTNSIPLNQWTHIVGLGEAGQALKIYINGVEDSATQSGTMPTLYQDANLFIGKDNGAAARNFNGKIDHVAAFDYALSASQITALYGNSTDGVGNPMSLSPKPKFYYPIGDYAAFNGSEYLVPNGALSDYVFDVTGSGQLMNLGGSNLWSNILVGTNRTGVATFSSWVKGPFTGYHRIWEMGVSGQDLLRVGTNQKLYYRFGSGSIYRRWTMPSGVDLDSSSWLHIVLVFKAGSVTDASGTAVGNGVADIDLFINGDLCSQDFLSAGASANTWGGGSYGIRNYSGQQLTERSNVQIWNSELTAIEIETLYNNGSPYLGTQPQSSNLQGWWKLDASATFDGTNWSIPDDSSNSNTGTSSGMTASNLVQSTLLITQPYSRYALNFDSASSDYIDCGTGLGDSLGTYTGDLTLSYWFNTDSLTANRGLFYIGSFSNAQGELQVNIYANSMRFRVEGGTKTKLLDITSLSTGTWYHIGFVYKAGDISGSKVYLNGAEQTTTDTGTFPSSLPFSGLKTIIGGYYGTGNTFGGKMSNVSIWNTDLTSAQVTELYNQGKPSNLNNHSAYSNLVSWWQLGENMSYDSNVWTVLDEKGTNNGTGANLAPAEDSIVNGVGTSANGLSDGMGGADNIVGEAPYSTANAVSYGMGVDAKSTSVPS
jgi:hypothetical protein